VSGILKLKEILAHYDTETVEFVNALVMFYLGVTLLRPGDTFNSGNVGYVVMAQISNEEIWGIVYFLIGLAGLIGTAAGVHWWRMVISAAETISLVSLGTLLILGNPMSTGGSYIILGLASGWCFIRNATDKRSKP
jgi:hypothetical protein